MFACVNKGEKFDFCGNQNLVEHRALRVHTFGESCTGKGEMHGVSALFSSWFCTGKGEMHGVSALFSSWFSFRF